MARLRLYDQQQVAPNVGPSVTATSPNTNAAEIAGAQMQQLGQQVQRTAQAAGNAYLQELERANTLRVNDALNRLRSGALDLEYGEQGFRARRGENAMPDAFEGRPLTEAYGERYEELARGAEELLSNDAQRQAFRAAAANLGVQFREQASRHEAAESVAYGRSVLEGGVMVATNEIATAYADADRVRAGVAQIGVLGNELFDRYAGLSGNERSARVQALQSAAITDVIRAAADAGDLSLARRYEEEFAETITAADRTKIDGLITPALDAQAARDAVQAVFRGEAPPPELGPDGEAPLVTLAAPVEGRTSSAFGPRVAPRTPTGRGSSNHAGVDYAVPEGTTVAAAGDGEVVFAGEQGGYGNTVIVRHADGRETLYAHLSEINVRQGDRVRAGAPIALSGNTGNSSGAHLHFEVRENGRAVDPATQLGEAGARRAQRAAETEERRAPPTTLREAVSRAEEHLGPRATPEQLRLVRQEVTYQWNLREAERDQREAQALDGVLQQLVANGGDFNALPASVRATIPAAQYDNVLSFARNLSQGEQPETNPALYYELQDPAQLNRLSDGEFVALRAQMAADDWERLAQRRQELRNPRTVGENAPGNLRVDAVSRAFNQYAQGLGFDPQSRDAEDRRRLGSMRMYVDQVVLDAQRTAGRQLNDTELRQLIGPLFTQTTTLRGTFGNRVSAPLLSVNAGAIRRGPAWDRVEQSLRARGVQNPTDTQIEVEYYRLNTTGR